MLAQATPTPIIDRINKFGSDIKNMEISPDPPKERHIKCVIFLLVAFAITGSKNATIAATPLYACKEYRYPIGAVIIYFRCSICCIVNMTGYCLCGIYPHGKQGKPGKELYISQLFHGFWHMK